MDSLARTDSSSPVELEDDPAAPQVFAGVVDGLRFEGGVWSMLLAEAYLWPDGPMTPGLAAKGRRRAKLKARLALTDKAMTDLVRLFMAVDDARNGRSEPPPGPRN